MNTDLILAPKFIDVGGIKTRYFESGRGENLVLIHGGQYGAYYNAYAWSLNWEGLSQNFHVYAFDKLGMGHTDNPKRDDDYLMSATIKHAHDFLVRLGIKEANLVGHSRGALVAARLAIDHDGLAKSLIIVDSNTLPPDDPLTPKNFYSDLDKNAPAVETRQSVLREPIANSYSPRHITEDFIDEWYSTAALPKTVEAVRKMKGLETTLFRPDLNRIRQETAQMIREGRLKAPTLTIWGLNDPSAPLKLSFDLAQMISPHVPRFQLNIFNQAGHYSFREHPEEFNQVVTTFINAPAQPKST